MAIKGCTRRDRHICPYTNSNVENGKVQEDVLQFSDRV